MGIKRNNFLKILLISTLMALSFSHGFGRKLMEISSTSTTKFEEFKEIYEENGGKSRGLIELMDYKDPGANTNPKAGYLFYPPPPA